MRLSNPVIPYSDFGIARAEADGLLLGWDRLFDRSDAELALTEMRNRGYPVAIGRDSKLEFGNGLCVSALCTQQLALGIVRERVAGGIALRGRYAFLLVRSRSGAGVGAATPRRRPACVIFGGFPRQSRHRVPDLSAYASKMRVPLLRALLEAHGDTRRTAG